MFLIRTKRVGAFKIYSVKYSSKTSGSRNVVNSRAAVNKVREMLIYVMK